MTYTTGTGPGMRTASKITLSANDKDAAPHANGILDASPSREPESCDLDLAAEIGHLIELCRRP